MKKYIRLGCAVILAAVLVTGCGSNGNKNMSSSYSMMDNAMPEAVAETTAASFHGEIGMTTQEYKEGVDYEEDRENGGVENENVENNATEIGRKLIKTVSMDVETEEFDSLIHQLLSRIDGLGGYVENSSTNNSSYYVNNGRYANYVIRIPSNRLDELVGNVTELANVTWKEETVQDITLRYVDVESHKIALQTEQERLLVLMEKAETVEDLIAIESRLSEIRYQIQNYESTLRTYDNQVNYSTLHLAISEVKKLTPQEELSVWEKIRDGFSENLDHVITGTKDFFVGVIIAIPYLVIWGIVLFFGYWVGRMFIKKRKKKMGFWHLKKSQITQETQNSVVGRSTEYTEKQDKDKEN